jgi:hypothetical protein
MNTNVIFYSKKCETSFKLLQLLEKEQFLQCFKLLCVDNIIDKLPPQITAVPTMIVKNVNKPLMPKECFDWVKQMVEARNMNSNENINGYNTFEQSKFSDVFTFLKSDDALEQSFFKYKDEKNNAIYTAPLEGKLNMTEQKKKINELEKSRKQQELNFKDAMKSEQQQILKNHKKQ